MSDDFNNLPSLADALKKVVKQSIVKTALDIQANAQSKAAVDTGFMKNSIYTVTAQGSDYGQAGTPTHKDSYLLPEVGPLENDTTAYVAAGANYSVYIDQGTRHQPAQPFFTPAVDEGMQSLETAFATLEDQLKRSI